MRIVWSNEKNQKLIIQRGICFEEAAERILQNDIVEILKNPAYPGQYFFVLELRDYIHVVPFLVNEKEEIVLKTIFPSRKFQRIYGRKK